MKHLLVISPYFTFFCAALRSAKNIASQLPYFPRLYVSGRTREHTINFPQDVVKIPATLPANPDILVDHLKVVFIGKGRPTTEMLIIVS